MTQAEERVALAPYAARLRDIRRKIVRVAALGPLLHRLAGPHRRVFYLAGAMTIIVGLVDSAVIVSAVPFIAHIVGSASGSQTGLSQWLSGYMPSADSERGIVLILMLLAGGIALREGLGGIAKTVAFYATALIVTHIRARIAENLLFAKETFIDVLPSGAPLQIVVSESRKVLQGSRAIISMVANLCVVVLLTIVLLNISVKLLSIMVGIALAVVPLKFLYSLKLFRFSQTSLTASLQLMDALTETIRGLRQIRVQNRQDAFRARIEGASQLSERSLLLANAMVANEPVIIHLFAITAIVGVLYAGYATNLASLAEMTAFFFVLYRLVPMLAGLSTQVNAMLAAEPGIMRVAELYDRDSSQAERTGGAKLTRAGIDSIVLRNVDLTYADGRTALYDVCLEARRGECIAIVGESGAGKSSILHLLLGIYDARGDILIDGRKIEEIDLRSLRDQLSLVPQDIYVIRSRVDELIAGGDPGIDRHRIESAARMAAADEFIGGLPKGYKTVIGTGGHPISGGERQRLALAQAFVRNPPVLLLDEATSALDPITEHRVLSSLEGWRDDKIVIFVTHRVTNLQNVDRIYTMKDGRIVEVGNWATLIGLNGEFAQIVRRQRGTAEVA